MSLSQTTPVDCNADPLHRVQIGIHEHEKSLERPGLSADAIAHLEAELRILKQTEFLLSPGVSRFVMEKLGLTNPPTRAQISLYYIESGGAARWPEKQLR